MLNPQVFKNIQQANKQILIVTKYWDSEKTLEILWEAQEKYPDVFFALWENRIESIIQKNISRDTIHFIGNIQSQKIWDIVKYCSVIHSLSNIKHARKIENIWQEISAFIQIQLDEDKNIWISEFELWNFLKICGDFKCLKIIWIAGMWSADCSQQEKRDEFQKLISLKNKYLPKWLISAWTSRDYELALDEWIDIVRVGNKALT